MLTEEQAREKWCPMARVVEIGDGELHGPFNRYHPDGAPRIPVAPNSCRCIASECMAWRWGFDERTLADRVRDATGLTLIEWIRDFRERNSESLMAARYAAEQEFSPARSGSVGYCGAFGRPGDAP